MAFEKDTQRGVLNSYGVRTTTGKFGAEDAAEHGIIRSATWDFAYNDLPSGSSANLSLCHKIPANSTIVRARLFIDSAFTSTSALTDLTVGLYRATDGTTAINATGLITATDATETTIGTAGNVITGTGALVGKLSDATYDGVLVVAPTTADLTAGTGRIVVEYVLNS